MLTFDEKIIELAGDLQETAKAFRAEGLAAIQVGAIYRMFVIKDSKSEDYITCINPEILSIQLTAPIDSMEGCLSFPGVNESVKRSEGIHVRFQDEGGQVVERAFNGMNSVAFQHELDHLNGILFIDHMGKLQKRMALKRLAKVKRQTSRQYKAVEAMMNKDLLKIELAKAKLGATVLAQETTV